MSVGYKNLLGVQTGRTETGGQNTPYRSDQVPNSGGGYSWPISDQQRLDRFLILGTLSSSYYASAQELTMQNIEAVKNLILTGGVDAVKRIMEISTSGRAPKNDPALIALAIAAKYGDLETRRFALNEGLMTVARTGTHLLHFVSYCQDATHKGWGRLMKQGVGNWYLSRSTGALAYQLLK